MIHYYLGLLLGKRYRLWYWRTHGNRYPWGVLRAIDELPVQDSPDVLSCLTPKELEKFIESLQRNIPSADDFCREWEQKNEDSRGSSRDWKVSVFPAKDVWSKRLWNNYWKRRNEEIDNSCVKLDINMDEVRKFWGED